MNTIELMRDKLASLQIDHLDIEDESAQHAGHAGAKSGGGHYRIHIVSSAFLGKNTLARHRLVYDALGSMMHNDIHALSILAHTPDEL
ncbi:MAG: BolA family protein [Pseudomonadota bacterium]|uniref:BolA family protein n=1 Tax=Sulfuriferula sp. TaxID=2025307 RepID=UPI0027304500|nr:BolA family protein [Sulfuriferula sp.]MDP2026665.1 BolA family protein [Sulfuriferula sp.]